MTFVPKIKIVAKNNVCLINKIYLINKVCKSQLKDICLASLYFPAQICSKHL